MKIVKIEKIEKSNFLINKTKYYNINIIVMFIIIL